MHINNLINRSMDKKPRIVEVKVSEKKPDDVANGHAMDKIVITDKTKNKEILNRRG